MLFQEVCEAAGYGISLTVRVFLARAYTQVKNTPFFSKLRVRPGSDPRNNSGDPFGGRYLWMGVNFMRQRGMRISANRSYPVPKSATTVVFSIEELAIEYARLLENFLVYEITFSVVAKDQQTGKWGYINQGGKSYSEAVRYMEKRREQFGNTFCTNCNIAFSSGLGNCPKCRQTIAIF